MNTTLGIHRLRQVVRRQHKAVSAESGYAYWLDRYIASLRRMAPTHSSEQKLERFLTNLARHRDVSASSQNQAFNAILFFYQQVLHKTIQGAGAAPHRPGAAGYHPPRVQQPDAVAPGGCPPTGRQVPQGKPATAGRGVI